MKKIYSSVDLTIVRLATQDIITNSPNGYLMMNKNGLTGVEGDYTTDGTNTTDYVW